MQTRRYVVTFSGARDSYQVPLALQQTKQLDCLVTDAYAPQLPAWAWLGPLPRRSATGLPIWKTRSFPRAFWFSHVALRFANEPLATRRRNLKRVQDMLSRAAADVAIKNGSDLFLYAGYARVAFSDPELSDARKILFMYHPHVAPSAEILSRDAKLYPEPELLLKGLDEDAKDRDVDIELELADLVICASEFTASSIAAVGVDRRKIAVVPYGIDTPEREPPARRRDKCRFLFVGSGIHRKGLHVLLESWRRAALPDSELTIVCRSLEPWLEARTGIPGVVLRRGVTAEELEALYASSCVFVLPSLVEGFGYVYLEALTRGCFCIGTENTGLPDLALEPGFGEVVKAGDVSTLTDALVRAHDLWRHDRLDPVEISRFVKRWSWSRFRTTVAGHARRLDLSDPSVRILAP